MKAPASATSKLRPFSFARDGSLPYLLVAPAITVLLALSIYPLIYAIKVAFQSGADGAAGWSLANFTRLFTDQFFLTALLHTFVYAAIALTIEFLLGLGLALLLDRQFRGRNFFRAVMLVPMM